MNALTYYLSPLAEGWVLTLFHSLWQGALIAGLVFLILWMFQVTNPRIRYGVALAGLSVFALAMAITLFQVMPSPSSTENAVSSTTQVTLTQFVAEGIVASEGGWGLLNVIRDNMPFILKIWAVGAILLLFRIIGGHQYLQKIMRRGEDTVPETWLRSIDRIAERLNIHRSITVLHSSHVDMPMVFGHLKPVLLLPVSLLSGMSQDQLEAIFAHELAHIRRNDYLVNMGQQVLEAFFFFNPFVWILSNHLRSEREKCCDDLAMEICQNERRYVEALSTLELYRVHSPENAMMLLGKKGELLARIKRLTDPSSGEVGSSKWVVMIVLSASFFLFSYFTNAPKEAEGDAQIAQVEQSLVAGIPASILTRRDTVPKKPAKKQTVIVQGKQNEIVEESIDEDGKVHVYRYYSSPDADVKVYVPSSDSDVQFYVQQQAGDSIIELSFGEGNNFTFAMPDIDMDMDLDVNGWVSDSPTSWAFVVSPDTIPGLRWMMRDSLLSEEDREAMREAQEELRKAQEMMREEQKRMREIMRKYREENPDLVREQQRALEELHRGLREKEHEMRIRGFAGDRDIAIQRVWRDQERLTQEEMERVQREVARAQKEIVRVRPIVQGYRFSGEANLHRNRLEGFKQEVIELLKQDDYLDQDDELRKMELTEDYFKYNGKKVKGGDFQKYLNAYQSRFGALEGKINIQLD